MLKAKKSNRRMYWLAILAFVLIIPLAVIFVMGKPEISKSFGAKTTKVFKVPTVAEQPQDTVVSAGVIPIHSWNTENGIKVVFVPTENLPILDIDVSISAGSARDGEYFGLAQLTAELLNQGTIRLPNKADDIALTFENAGTIYKVEVDRDRTRILLRSVSDSKDLDTVVALFSEVIATPAFDANTIDRLKEQTITAIKYNQQIPENIITDEFFKIAYEHHPYSHPVLGIVDAVSKIDFAALKAFHQKYYVANNATITIVGGMHRDRVREIANKIASALPVGEEALPLPKVADLPANINKTIHHPVNQAKVILGRKGIEIADPDKYALLVGNYILGAGPFTSRLFKEIRMDKGLAYSVYSYLALMEQAGPFIATLETRNAQAEEALEALTTIVDDFVANGPSETELQAAKKHLVGAFPLNFGSNSKILEATSTLNYYKLPFDYFDNYIKNIEAVNVDAVKLAFKNKLNTAQMVQVILSAGT